ncbi:MAG: hypothetical protein WC806_00835 [Candidatus Gracilibacteria bacterium]|jgi:hypothetical protein
MKKLLVFSVFVISILTLSACNSQNNISPAPSAEKNTNTINSQIETSVLAVLPSNSSADLIAKATTKTTNQYDGNYSISGTITCKYDTPSIPDSKIPLEATTVSVSKNTLIDTSTKKPITIDSKGKATVSTTQTDATTGIKTVAKAIYQFTKTKVTGKITMTITVPMEDGSTVTAKCSGTVSGKKLK